MIKDVAGQVSESNKKQTKPFVTETLVLQLADEMIDAILSECRK